MASWFPHGDASEVVMLFLTRLSFFQNSLSQEVKVGQASIYEK